MSIFLESGTIVAWMAPEEVSFPTRKHAICGGPPYPMYHNQTEVEVQLHRLLTVLDVVNRVLEIRHTSYTRVDSENVWDCVVPSRSDRECLDLWALQDGQASAPQRLPASVVPLPSVSLERLHHSLQLSSRAQPSSLWQRTNFLPFATVCGWVLLGTNCVPVSARRSLQYPCWARRPRDRIAFWSLRSGRCHNPFDFTVNIKRSFVRILELMPNPMLLCGRIFLSARFPLVTSPQIWARKDCAHPRDGPFLSRILVWCQVVLENLTARFVPNFPSSRRIEFLG